MIKSITYLKSRFQTGDKPTEQDFIDLLDSVSFLIGQAEITDSGLIAALVNASNWNDDGEYTASMASFTSGMYYVDLTTGTKYQVWQITVGGNPTLVIERTRFGNV